jgi:hypothetical protein
MTRGEVLAIRAIDWKQIEATSYLPINPDREVDRKIPSRVNSPICPPQQTS